MVKKQTLVAPFPYFGGKSRVSSVVWDLLGYDIDSYIEPFLGSGAVLLGRPARPANCVETVNDRDGMLVNVWRCLKYHPDETLLACSDPPSSLDNYAKHKTLLEARSDLTEKIKNDPRYGDPELAGWWIYCACGLAGNDFASNKPRSSLHLGNKGTGVNRTTQDNQEWFGSLRDRLQRVRIFCGDWKGVTTHSGSCAGSSSWGFFVDPPYASDRNQEYLEDATASLHSEIEEWALTTGDKPNHRIVICGYEQEYPRLVGNGWRTFGWKTNGGFGNQSQSQGRENAKRETLFVSPQCLDFKGLDNV